MIITPKVLDECKTLDHNRKNLTTVYLRAVPRHVRDQFKAYCAQRGVSMNAMLVHLMRETIKVRNQLIIERQNVKQRRTERQTVREESQLIREIKELRNTPEE